MRQAISEQTLTEREAAMLREYRKRPEWKKDKIHKWDFLTLNGSKRASRLSKMMVAGQLSGEDLLKII